MDPHLVDNAVEAMIRGRPPRAVTEAQYNARASRIGIQCGRDPRCHSVPIKSKGAVGCYNYRHMDKGTTVYEYR